MAVDWAVPIAIVVGFVIVTLASIQAGEGGLASNVYHFVASPNAES